MSRGFGLRKDTKNVLDYNGEFRLGGSNEVLPSEYMLDEEFIPDCRDQGSVSSCVGYSITNIMQILNYHETGKRDRFSAGYVYGRCRDAEDKYTGMFIRSTLDHLIKLGSCLEEDFPHNEEMTLIQEMVHQHPELDKKAFPYRIRGYEVYNKADKQSKLNSIKSAILKYKVPILTSTDQFREPHAVCIIGWNDDKEQFYIMNSWGEGFGNKGIGTINYNKTDWGYLLLDEKNSNVLMPFDDVKEDKWYYKAVQHVYNAGLMNGTSDNTFEPEKTMTRAEMAQVLVNLCKKFDEVRGGK